MPNEKLVKVLGILVEKLRRIEGEAAAVREVLDNLQERFKRSQPPAAGVGGGGEVAGP